MKNKVYLYQRVVRFCACVSQVLAKMVGTYAFFYYLISLG